MGFDVSSPTSAAVSYHHQYSTTSPLSQSQCTVREQSTAEPALETTSSATNVTYSDLCFPKTSNYGSMRKQHSAVGPRPLDIYHNRRQNSNNSINNSFAAAIVVADT